MRLASGRKHFVTVRSGTGINWGLTCVIRGQSGAALFRNGGLAFRQGGKEMAAASRSPLPPARPGSRWRPRPEGPAAILGEGSPAPQGPVAGQGRRSGPEEKTTFWPRFAVKSSIAHFKHLIASFLPPKMSFCWV